MNCIKCRAEIPAGGIFCPFCGKKQIKEPRKALKRANGTGTVYKLQGRRRRPWVAARNRTILGYYETKTAALECLNRLAGREISERYNMTFEEVFDAWKTEHYQTLTASGRSQYDISFQVFSGLHKKKFRDLRTADFQTALEPHMGKKHSTVSKYKQLITQMSKWAIREELLTTNFASFVRLPEQVKQEKEIFSDTDIQRLEQNGSETAKIILMLIYTGMRIGELFALTLDDYHGRYVVGGEKTEAGRNRVIPICPEGRGYFQYFAEQATGAQLLSGYAGQHTPNNFRRRDYYPLLNKLEIARKTPHATRHTYASRARKAGMPPEVLQKILGHADYHTTASIYVHTDVEELLRAVEV
ncbi:MAG: tyrosine-type recombinase/integrase [Oscillospiraceae bacterium]|nr:tyrosine-type recombinase/integrase [Oscillospiraceae bacterium]